MKSRTEEGGREGGKRERELRERDSKRTQRGERRRWRWVKRERKREE